MSKIQSDKWYVVSARNHNVVSSEHSSKEDAWKEFHAVVDRCFEAAFDRKTKAEAVSSLAHIDKVCVQEELPIFVVSSGIKLLQEVIDSIRCGSAVSFAASHRS
jgi:hypothetical protein